MKHLNKRFILLLIATLVVTVTATITSFLALRSNFWGIRDYLVLAQSSLQFSTEKLETDSYTVELELTNEGRKTKVVYTNTKSGEKFVLRESNDYNNEESPAYALLTVKEQDFLIVRGRNVLQGTMGGVGPYDYMLFRLGEKADVIKLGAETKLESCHGVIWESGKPRFYHHPEVPRNMYVRACYGLIPGIGPNEYGATLEVDLSETQTLKNSPIVKISGSMAPDPRYLVSEYEPHRLCPYLDLFVNKIDNKVYVLQPTSAAPKPSAVTSCKEVGPWVLYGYTGNTTPEGQEFYILGKEPAN